MVVQSQHIWELIKILVENEGMQVLVTSVSKGTAIAGGCSALAALAFGPIGFAIGGSLGGILASKMTNGEFKPLHVVLNDFSQRDRNRLINKLKDFVDELDATDLMSLLYLTQRDIDFKDLLLMTIARALESEFRMKISSRFNGLQEASGGGSGNIGIGQKDMHNGP